MTQTDQQNVPKLRFLKDDGDNFPDWKENRLGEVANIRTGKKDVNEGNPDGVFPFFTCAKQHTYSDSYSFDTDAILIAGNGEVGHCQRYSGKFEAYQRTYVLSGFMTSFDYLYVYMSTKFVEHVQSQKQMGAMPYIKLGALKNFPIPFPHPDEQRKIASFLGAVDTKIAQLARKKALFEDYKKGCMQQLFSQKIRFKDDDGKDFPDWEEKRLGEVLTIGSGRDYKHLGEGNIPVYGTGGLMKHVDDFLYDGESVCIGRKGTIDKPVFLTGKFWTVDTLFYTHSFNNALPRFIYAIFQQINWQIHNEASGVPSLSKSTIERLPVSLPHPDEQRKIADFLSALDRKLELVGQELEHAKTFKKGLLQQMFV